MPALTVTGDVFKLGGTLEGSDGVTYHEKIGAEARISVTGEFEMCHGLNAGLSAEAAAEVEGAIAVLLPSIHAQGSAFVSAGVQVTARIAPDLFDSFGFSAEAKAHVEASVAGRIGIGLDWFTVAALARSQLPNLAYDIFIAFINEVVAEAGVWGKASFSAQASAYLDVKGTLADDGDAGFIIEAGASAAYGGGAGWDFYAGLRLTDPKRFYNYAVERITAELVREARRRLPAEQRPAVELLDFVLPLTLEVAYEVGQQATLHALDNSEFVVQPFIDTFFARLQRHLIDKFAAAGERLLALAIEDVLYRASNQHLEASQREELRTKIQNLIDQLTGTPLTFDIIQPVVTSLVDIFGIVAPEEARRWRQPLAVLWVSLAMANALRTVFRRVRGEGGIVGLGTVTVGQEAVGLAIGEPPEALEEELPFPEGMTFSDGVDYLVFNTDVAPALETILPELSLLFRMLESELGITPGNVVEAGLLGGAGEGFSRTVLYRKLRTIVKTSIDNYVTADVLPTLRVELESEPDALVWIDEVAEPCLLATSGFAFDQLDVAVDGISLWTLEPFLKSFRSGLSALAAKVVIRNVVVFADIVLRHTIEYLHDGLGRLADTVRNSPEHPMATEAVQLVERLLPPGFESRLERLKGPTRELVADLLEAGADSFGPRVWTASRRVTMRRHMIKLLLSMDGNVDYSDPASVEAFFVGLRECVYTPDPDTLMKLLGLFCDITADELRIVAPRAVSAVAAFLLKLTHELLIAMEEAFREFAAAATAAAQAARNALDDATGKVVRLLAELTAAGEKVATAFRDIARQIASYLGDPDQRSAILDKVEDSGEANAETLARSARGFDLLPAEAQADAVATAVRAFDVAFSLVRPLLDRALEGLSAMADSLGNAVADAVDVPDALNRLAAAVAREIPGSDLPDEISADDVGKIAIEVLTSQPALRSALRDAQSKVEAKNAARERHDAAAREESRARREWQEKDSRHRELLASERNRNLRVEFLSPLALSATTGDAAVYPGEVDFCLRVQGANQSFVRPGAPSRVLLALNAVPIEVAASEWISEAGRPLIIRKRLSMTNAPMRLGMNHLECSVVNYSGGATIRESVAFIVGPHLASEERLVIDGLSSVFNPPGDDHEYAAMERVVVRNLGTRAVQLAGWRLRDRGSHQFVFPAFNLRPDAFVAVHTGEGRDTDYALYWNRRRAVWNNLGDLAVLIDANGVIRASYVVSP